ncbi:MAG: DUF2442 domain-containing protein [Acidobacteriota bacterium]
MSTAASSDPRIQNVRVTEDEIIAHLADGRVISVPLAWSWRLSEATPAQRAKFRLIGSGQGVHWPDIDEDISVEGMLHGVPAPRPRSAAAQVRAGATRRGLPNKRIRPTRQKAARGGQLSSAAHPTAATASISTRASRGRRATSTVARAGGLSRK